MLKKTGRKGSICDYEYEEIRQMEVGSWFSPDYEGERIVSLEDFLFYFSKRNMEYQIELKDKDIEYEVIELLKKYDVIGKVVITSFESSILSRTKSINPNVKTGWLINRLDDLLIEKAKKLKIDILSLKAHIINENSVLYVKKNNFAIRAWNVKDVETMKKLLTFDIDGMTIDFPDKLYHVR
jgi:glycerophosphoryl diester phosphodiesterase